MKRLTCKAWFWFGHFVSVCDNWENQPEWFADIWYPVYNYSMIKSFNISEDNGLNEWTEG